MQRIAFDDVPWATSTPTVRTKVLQRGARRLRLLEFTPQLEHPDWCLAGHVGIVLAGTLEVSFANGPPVVYRAGDGLFIEPGEGEKHKPRALTEWVRVVFVEDVAL